MRYSTLAGTLWILVATPAVGGDPICESFARHIESDLTEMAQAGRKHGAVWTHRHLIYMARRAARLGNQNLEGVTVDSPETAQIFRDYDPTLLEEAVSTLRRLRGQVRDVGARSAEVTFGPQARPVLYLPSSQPDNRILAHELKHLSYFEELIERQITSGADFPSALIEALAQMRQPMSSLITEAEAVIAEMSYADPGLTNSPMYLLYLANYPIFSALRAYYAFSVELELVMPVSKNRHLFQEQIRGKMQEMMTAAQGKTARRRQGLAELYRRRAVATFGSERFAELAQKTAQLGSRAVHQAALSWMSPRSHLGAAEPGLDIVYYVEFSRSLDSLEQIFLSEQLDAAPTEFRDLLRSIGP